MPRTRPLGSRILMTVERLATFRTVTVAVFHHARETGPTTDARIVRVDDANLGEASAMDPPERVEEFRGFLARGDVGYYAYLGGRVVHRTWVRRGPVRGPLWLAWGSLEVGPSQAYVHYCETAPAARGHGIYPAVIAHAAREARDAGARDVLISSRVDNVASLRGIARAGFDERERHVLRIRFGRCVQSRVIGPSPARPAPQ